MADQQQPEPTTTEPVQEERKSSLVTDILTIIGFAILFIIIIWGLVHLVELITSSFSPSKPAATIQVSAPAQATSGEPITISWSYSPSVSGSYAFLYQCQNGLTFQLSDAKTSGIPCGVAYTIGAATSSISVIPELSAKSSVSDTVSIVFIPSQNGSQVQGDATITVNPASAKPSTPAKTATKPAVPKIAQHHAGPADLAVNIISGSIDANGNGTVTFNIANVGGSSSGNYQFSAQIPTAQPYPYTSPMQAPLKPGAHVVSTLNFTDAQSGGGLFSVSILDGGETNSSNDYASIELTGPYNYNNGYNNQQPYLQYPTYQY